VDLEVLWRVVEVEVPSLLTLTERLIATLESPGPGVR
jgi:hypothetical protein